MNETLDNLVSVTLLNLAETGYSDSTIAEHRRAYAHLAEFCAANGIPAYDRTVGQSFLDDVVSEKYPPGSKKNLDIRRYMKRLDCTVRDIEWIPEKTGRRAVPYVHSCYDDQLAAYEAYLFSTGKTEKDVRSRTHCAARFLKFIENRRITGLSAIFAEDIYAAFQEASDKNRFRRLVGHFLKYAYKYGLTEADLYQFIPAAVRHKAVPSVYSPEEVGQLLLSVDRSSKTGKRNYAIMVIAARLGLRASDIAGLTFDSINEISATVKVTQRKTGEPLTLPLLDEVKEALHDYLDNARPAQDDCHIFLKARGKGPMSPANIGKVVELAFNASGVDCGTRRRGSHSLRASLATALLEEGNGYHTIKQVLGHSDVQSTKSYVKASVECLRANALPVPKPAGNFMRLLSKGGA